MTETRPAVTDLGQQPGAGEPVRPRRHAADGEDRVDIELLTRHRGGLEQLPFLASQP